MRPRHIVMLAALGLLAPFASPASAAPYCFVDNWQSGDTCTFEAPAGALIFGGDATISEPTRAAWIAVEVVFNGVVIASCYGTDNGFGVATCDGTTQVFAPTLPHVCRAYGTGGQGFLCADPPPTTTR